MAPSLFLLIAVATLTAHQVSAQGLDIKINKDASYQVTVDGSVWFESDETKYTMDGMTKSTHDKSANITSFTTGMGSDSVGHYASTTIDFDGGVYTVEFKKYSDKIVFEQRFPKGLKGTSLNASRPMKVRDMVSTSFPSFKKPSSTTDDAKRGYLAYSGSMTGANYMYGEYTSSDAKLPTGVKGYGPACVFSEDMSDAVVISSFSQFMAASAGPSASGGIAYGVQGSILEYPEDYSVSFILSYTAKTGINEAFLNWGTTLLHKYGKERDACYDDYALKYLGYSTDNGAFYYYQTEDGPGGGPGGQRGPPFGGKSYEQTLIDVKKYSDKVGIPYKYILLDSWWYYKGAGGGVANWIGRPDVFPHGNSYLRNQTGWPIQGHNRFWATDNIYATVNGGDYDFVTERIGEGQDFNNFSWPTEQRFWDDLIYNSTKWGLFMYEQDWLDTEYDNVVHLNTDATAARTWLMQMGQACERNSVTIQYCMSYCRHIMQSVEIPSVTNARASGDYHPGQDQWKQLGTTGIFAHAVGIAPTKDNYWSTTAVQTNSSYRDFKTVREPYSRLQAAVSTVSKGPVCPSDKIGDSNVDLIMMSCAADGRLLQGDAPAMTIPMIHARRAFNKDESSELWMTKTTLDDFKFATLLGATLSEDMTVSVQKDLLLDSEYVAYEINVTDKIMRSADLSLDFKKCGKADFQFYALAPTLPNNWTMLGEPSKWIPVSKSRFSNLEYGMDSESSYVSVVAEGPEMEQIIVAFLTPDNQYVTVDCTIPSGSRAKVTVGLKGDEQYQRCTQL